MSRLILVTHIPHPHRPAAVKTLGAIVTAEDVLVGVDGGTELLVTAGLSPHVVIGDFDSLPPAAVSELKSAQVPVIEYPREKDYTDLELALLYTLGRPERRVALVTCGAGRPDHTYANMLLVADRRFREKQVEVHDGSFRWLILHGPATTELEPSPGHLLSIVPVSDQVSGLSIRGARWELDDAIVERGSTRCVSNELAERRCHVSIRSGSAIVLIGREE